MRASIRLAPRWYKILNDVLENKARTILVILAIAVGVIAFGSVFIAREMAVTDMNQAYRATHPPEILIYGSPFDQSTERTIEQMQHVDGAQGWSTAWLKMQYNGEWLNIDLYAVRDFADMHVGLIEPETGDWPPDTREIWFERATVEFLGAEPGKSITIELPDGTRRELTVAGTVHDINAVPPNLSNWPQGYVTLETLDWLGLPNEYSYVAVSLEDSITDLEQIEQIRTEISDRLERYGYRIWGGYSPAPGKHWAADQVEAFSLVLASIGALTLLLSGFMVINTVSSLIMQQKRQIGMMKTVGATGGQVFSLYLLEICVLGLCAVLVSIPLSLVLGSIFADTIAGYLNFDIEQFRLALWILLLQLAAALVVPVLAASLPIFRGIRTTVREAVSDYGIGMDVKQGWLDVLLTRARFLSRPILVSLQNAFRRKGRMAITLITLTIAGSIFMSVFTLQHSLMQELDRVMELYGFDVQVMLEQPYPIRRLEQEAMRVPGVDHVEGWAFVWAQRVKPGEDTEEIEGGGFEILAPPIGETYLDPEILEGRWLLPDDENALVVSTAVLEQEPDIKVGDTVTLDIRGKEREWLIVGFLNAGPGKRVAYANFPYLSRLTGMPGRVYVLFVFTQEHDLQTQQRVALAVEEQLKDAGILLSQSLTMQEVAGANIAQFNLLVGFLLSMTVLLAIVGGLGLTSTMSLNVLERTREIGVMRAVGATNGSVRSIVVVEGAVVGLLSWLLAVPLSFPLAIGLCTAIGNVFFEYSLSSSFSLVGIVYWLAISLVISIVACLIPARRAVRISVREALAYE
ncbi:MAG: FtsX-like permease family protein [Anaerolineae bacterium]|nr:FtsX-like permease family protein [Anaerolineae bacterium]